MWRADVHARCAGTGWNEVAGEKRWPRKERAELAHAAPPEPLPKEGVQVWGWRGLDAAGRA